MQVKISRCVGPCSYYESGTLPGSPCVVVIYKFIVPIPIDDGNFMTQFDFCSKLQPYLMGLLPDFLVQHKKLRNFLSGFGFWVLIRI
jgi:hypothetical protein